MQSAAYKPSDSEVAQLISIRHMPGFEIYQKIMLAAVDQFQIDLMNTDPADEKYESLVRTRHNLALSAAMFYEKVEQKVAGYISDFGAKNDARKVLPDPTQELLDY
jgi:hypothetical protein